MKKVLSVLLAAVMLLSIFPAAAFAVNGPDPEIDSWGNYYASLTVYDTQSGTQYNLYSGGVVTNEAQGMVYDLASNTLTIENIDAATSQLKAVAMGDDFTLKVNGKCALQQISLEANYYGASLKITGDGELTLNELRRSKHGIFVDADSTAGKLTFGKEVELRIYGAAGESAVVSDDSIGKTVNEVFVFENGIEEPVRKVSSTTTHGEYTNVIVYEADGTTYYGGILLKSATDPLGIYAVRDFTRDNDGKTYYEVIKYAYISKYDAYVADYNYFKGDPREKYGVLEFTEEEWENQKEFSVVTRQTTDGAKVNYYDPEELDGSSYYTETQVTSASDPTGIYGRTSYTITDSQGNIEEKGFNISRFVYAAAPYNKKLIKDTSFATISITEEEFASSGEWSVVQGVEEVRLTWDNSVEATDMPVYKDSSGNKYVVEDENNIYSFNANDGITIGNTFYVYLKKVNVSYSALKPSIVTETSAESSYFLNTDEFAYNLHKHIYNIAVSVRPRANALGYTHYKCSCGLFKKDSAGNLVTTYIAPTGKPTGFKCASRTATAEKFTWNKTSGVTGYQVQILNAKGGNAGLKALTGNVYTFTKLAAGHAYKARVRFYIKAADGKNYYGAWTTINSPTLPAGTSITKVTGAKKAFTAQWKKGACTGYQLQYATNNKFSGAKTITIKKAGTLKYTVSKLAAKKAYYVRVRTYKTMNKVNYYSAWSGAKAVKTK